jgi:CRISPR-associated protein Csb1
VASGGVKNERVTPGKEEGKSAAEGYGNVPFSRDEFTAERILLFVNVDLAQIRGYGLGPDVERLLQLLVLFKLRALLDGDLRLRTACDFAVSTEGPVLATNPKGWILPEKAAILEQLISAIAVLRSRMEVTTLSFIGPTKKPANEEPSQSEESEDSDTSGSGDEA